MELADKTVSRLLLPDFLKQVLPFAKTGREGRTILANVDGVQFSCHIALYSVISQANDTHGEACGWSVKRAYADRGRYALVICRSCKEDTFREAQYFVGHFNAGQKQLTIYDTTRKLFRLNELVSRVKDTAEQAKKAEEVKKMEEPTQELGMRKAGNGYEYRFLYGGKVRSGYGHTEEEARANAEKRRAELKARDEPPKKPENAFVIHFPADGTPPTVEKRGRLRAGEIMRALAVITREASYDFFEDQIIEVVERALKGEVK